MNTSRRLCFALFVASLIACLCLFVPALVRAQDTTDQGGSTDTADEGTREVNWNESQSLKAENVAGAASEALAKEAEEALANLDAAEARLAAANENLSAAEDNLAAVKANTEATAEEIAAAQKAVEDAKAAAEAAGASVDDAEKAADEAAANAMSVNVDTVRSMRAQGMGWGVICHELGVHPSVLGNALGKKKGTEEEEAGLFEKAWGKVKDVVSGAFGLGEKENKKDKGTEDVADATTNPGKNKDKDKDKDKGDKGNSGGGHGGGNGGHKK